MPRIPGMDFARRCAQAFASSRLVSASMRFRMLRRLGLKNLEYAQISPEVYISDLGGLHGRGGCFINTRCFFDNGPIYIGAKVLIAAGVMVLTSTHEIGGPEQRGGAGIQLPVKIGDGCWIGAGAIIFPGVTIGNGCVIGAGAVVTKDCAPNGVYAGVPAQRVRDLEEVD